MARLLVVAHNAFGRNTNMGKTLTSYFDGGNVDEIAEIYLHSEIPNGSICGNFYRMTDIDAIRSIVFRNRCGGKINCSDSDLNGGNPGTDTGLVVKVYQRGRRRTPITYILRNAWWACSAWNSKQLKKWLDDFEPSAIFFASGDYSFSYRIACELAKQRKIPLIVCCMDDYYLYNKNESSILGRWQHKRFMKVVAATMAQASCIMAINDKMSQMYEQMFNKRCFTLHTGAKQKRAPFSDDEKEGISYLGNLSLGRNEQLVTIGRVLKQISSELYLDVYSGEKNPEFLKELTSENGIRFHGAISAEQVSETIAKSLAIVHTESFDKENKHRVMYSTSTKIAESLASGTCLVAYGPAEVASMEYLIKNDAAITITSPDELRLSLTRALKDAELRKKVVTNALRLAEDNHRVEKVTSTVRAAVQFACNSYQGE